MENNKIQRKWHKYGHCDNCNKNKGEEQLLEYGVLLLCKECKEKFEKSASENFRKNFPDY